MIELRGVSRRHGEVVAVDNLSLEVASGELCVLVGPSGCGKTTTLKMINRLIEPTSGEIRIDGVDVQSIDPVELRRGIGYVSQQGGLFPHRRVGDNVATIPRLHGWSAPRVAARVDELLELVGLDPSTYRRRWPHELSGGERQRVGVARALGIGPPVLLMDEPFGAVDPIARKRLQTEFRDLHRRLKTTVVFVTHDVDEALVLGDRIAILGKGARLAQFGTPAAILGRPASAFVAEFVGVERDLDRLAFVALCADDLDPIGPHGTNAGVEVALGDSLRSVLRRLLDAPEPIAAVRDGDALVGTVDLESIHRALRREARRASEQSAVLD